MSKTLLTQRLRDLARVGVIDARDRGDGRFEYVPTQAGSALWDVCEALGNWGARWLDVAPEHLDPYVVLWSLCNSLDAERLPPRRVLVRLDFPDVKGRNRFWLLLADGGGGVCIRHPGFDEDLFVKAESEWFAKWHMGWVPWAEALRSGHIAVEGPRDLARSFPTWNKLSHFAHVRPVAPAQRLSVQRLLREASESGPL